MDRAQADLEANGVGNFLAAERQNVGLLEDDGARRLLLGFESVGTD